MLLFGYFKTTYSGLCTTHLLKHGKNVWFMSKASIF